MICSLRHLRLALLPLAAVLALTALTALAAGRRVDIRSYSVERAVDTPVSLRAIDLMVDSVSWRPDLVRVYGRLTGRPNTSARIDGFTLQANGRSFTSDDIDGFDYQRAFQWEEDGVIPVEIDFPAVAPVPDRFILRADTPRGACRWAVSHHSAK